MKSKDRDRLLINLRLGSFFLSGGNVGPNTGFPKFLAGSKGNGLAPRVFFPPSSDSFPPKLVINVIFSGELLLDLDSEDDLFAAVAVFSSSSPVGEGGTAYVA